MKIKSDRDSFHPNDMHLDTLKSEKNVIQMEYIYI